MSTHTDRARPEAIEPDSKDWTWVLQRQCPQCGFNSAAFPREQLGERIRANARSWVGALDLPDLRLRPAPKVWSPLEYACHVRDVNALFAQRLALMLSQNAPTFANWDQDATAVAQRYDLADPQAVARELADAADKVAGIYDSVVDRQWQRQGLRSNGSAFTVESLGRYHLHDIVHHLHDIRYDRPSPPAGGLGDPR